MTKDEIQFWMLIAFAVTFVLSSYKIYIMFNVPSQGIDTKTQHIQLETIIINFLKDLQSSNYDEKELFDQLLHLEVLQDTEYKNFNLNRFYQILEELYLTYKVNTLPTLIKTLQNK